MAVRYWPVKPWPPTLPLSAPPFHQISLPASRAPPRKLHAVRFSIETLPAFHTMSPLTPEAPPAACTAYGLALDDAEPLRPKFCAEPLLLHAADPGLVPSTITVLRFMPRMCRSGVVMSTRGRELRRALGRRDVRRLVVPGPDQDPVAGPGRLDSRLDRAELALDPVVGPDAQDLGCKRLPAARSSRPGRRQRRRHDAWLSSQRRCRSTAARSYTPRSHRPLAAA